MAIQGCSLLLVYFTRKSNTVAKLPNSKRKKGNGIQTPELLNQGCPGCSSVQLEQTNVLNYKRASISSLSYQLTSP